MGILGGGGVPVLMCVLVCSVLRDDEANIYSIGYIYQQNLDDQESDSRTYPTSISIKYYKAKCIYIYTFQ